MVQGPARLEPRGVGESSPGMRALSDMSPTVREGAVHVICGENGAVESTLIEMISGLIQPDAGARARHIHDPAEAELHPGDHRDGDDVHRARAAQPTDPDQVIQADLITKHNVDKFVGLHRQLGDIR